MAALPSWGRAGGSNFLIDLFNDDDDAGVGGTLTRPTRSIAAISCSTSTCDRTILALTADAADFMQKSFGRSEILSVLAELEAHDRIDA